MEMASTSSNIGYLAGQQRALVNRHSHPNMRHRMERTGESHHTYPRAKAHPHDGAGPSTLPASRHQSSRHAKYDEEAHRGRTMLRTADVGHLRIKSDARHDCECDHDLNSPPSVFSDSSDESETSSIFSEDDGRSSEGAVTSQFGESWESRRRRSDPLAPRQGLSGMPYADDASVVIYKEDDVYARPSPASESDDADKLVGQFAYFIRSSARRQRLSAVHVFDATSDRIRSQPTDAGKGEKHEGVHRAHSDGAHHLPRRPPMYRNPPLPSELYAMRVVRQGTQSRPFSRPPIPDFDHL